LHFRKDYLAFLPLHFHLAAYNIEYSTDDIAKQRKLHLLKSLFFIFYFDLTGEALNRRSIQNNRLAFGSGAFGTSLIFTVLTMFFMFFLTQVQGLSGIAIGIAFLVIRIWDAFSDPLIGGIIARVNLKFGKYKFWLLIGSVFAAFFFVLMFLDMPFGSVGLYVYYIACYFFFGICFSFVDISYWSLIPASTSDEQKQGKLTSVAQVFANVGPVLVAVLAPLAVGLVPAYTASIYLYIALVVVILFLLTIAMPILFMKERTDTCVPERITIRQIWHAFKKNDQAIGFFVPSIFLDIALALTLQLGLFYFTYDIGDATQFSIFMIVSGVAIVSAVLSYPFMSKKLGAKTVFISACVLGIIGYNLMFAANMLFQTNIWVLSSLAVAAMIGFGWINVARMIMVNKVCDYSEEKFGVRTESIWVSLRTLSAKFGSAIVALIAGVVLDITAIAGSGPAEITDNAILSLRLLVFVLPILFVSLGLLSYLLMFKLDNRKTKIFPPECECMPEKEEKEKSDG